MFNAPVKSITIQLMDNDRYKLGTVRWVAGKPKHKYYGKVDNIDEAIKQARVFLLEKCKGENVNDLWSD